MELKLNYGEIAKYVKDHFNQEVALSRVNDRTVNVTVSKKVIVTITVNVRLQVIEMADTRIIIGYDAAMMGVDSIISGAISVLMGRYPELSQGVTLLPDHKISVDLSKIEKAKPLTDNLSLESLLFSEEHLTLKASLK